MRLTKLLLIILFTALAALSAGCETGLGNLFKGKPGPPPAGGEAAAEEEVYLLRVPQITRDKEACSGPAALAMVIQFWTQDPASAGFAENLTCPDEGFEARELVRLAVERDFKALAYKGGLPDLFRQLTDGRPLIAALKEGEGLGYVVLSGYYQDGRLVVNDPLKGRRVYLIQDFMERWKGTDYSTVAISPKD